MARKPVIDKAVVVVGGVLVLIGLAAWPTMVHPRLHPEYYSECELFDSTHNHTHNAISVLCLYCACRREAEMDKR